MAASIENKSKNFVVFATIYHYQAINKEKTPQPITKESMKATSSNTFITKENICHSTI
jgi:hypothetical protein